MADANSGDLFSGVADAVKQAQSEVGQAATGQNVDNKMVATAGQAQQMANEGQKMLASAQGGGFHLEPDAADTLIKSVQHSLQILEGTDDHLNVIRQAPKLGETPGAKVVGPFTQQVATGGSAGAGMVDVIGSLRSTLKQMEQAYKIAKQNYQEADQQAADGVKKAADGL